MNAFSEKILEKAANDHMFPRVCLNYSDIGEQKSLKYGKMGRLRFVFIRAAHCQHSEFHYKPTAKSFHENYIQLGHCSGELTESPAVTPGRMNIHFALDVDKTARGFEFIDLLEVSDDCKLYVVSKNISASRDEMKARTSNKGEQNMTILANGTLHS